MAFVWVAQPRWPATQALAYTTPHKLYQSANTEWTIQHMLSAVITTHARQHTELLIRWSWSQHDKNTTVTDYTMELRLPYSCWRNSWQNWTPNVIYTLYINIFQRRKSVLFGSNYLHEWVAHIHCKPFKKNTQFVAGDPCVLFHWQHNARKGMRELNESRHSKDCSEGP